MLKRRGSKKTATGGDTIGKGIILELEDTDTIAFDEILAFLKQHPEFEKYTLDKEPVLSLPGLEIRPDEQKVYRNNREVKLTVKEYKILCLLVLNRNRVLTYEQIYRRIWGEDAIGNETNAVGCHVRNLRRKLLQAAPDPPHSNSSLSGKPVIAFKSNQSYITAV